MGFALSRLGSAGHPTVPSRDGRRDRIGDDDVRRSLPSKPKALTDEEAEIGRLTVFGLPNEEVIDGKLVKADWPLTLEQAARFVGYR